MFVQLRTSNFVEEARYSKTCGESRIVEDADNVRDRLEGQSGRRDGFNEPMSWLFTISASISQRDSVGQGDGDCYPLTGMLYFYVGLNS
jgi:hypothetical protein